MNLEIRMLCVISIHSPLKSPKRIKRFACPWCWPRRKEVKGRLLERYCSFLSILLLFLLEDLLAVFGKWSQNQLNSCYILKWTLHELNDHLMNSEKCITLFLNWNITQCRHDTLTFWHSVDLSGSFQTHATCEVLFIPHTVHPTQWDTHSSPNFHSLFRSRQSMTVCAAM